MFTLDKRDNLFILTLTGSDDHRLDSSTIDLLLRHLSTVKSQATRGSVLITTSSSNSKFFSNGFDLNWVRQASTSAGAIQRLGSLVEGFKSVVAAFLSLPMPTVAAVTGHAAAAGMALGLCHDYVVMRKDRGVMYMSEVDIGLTMPDYFAELFRERVGCPLVRRDVLLRGVKVKGEGAVKMKLVDEAVEGGWEGTVERAVKLGEELGKRKWDGEVYAEIRKGLYPGLCRMLGLKIVPLAKL